MQSRSCGDTAPASRAATKCTHSVIHALCQVVPYIFIDTQNISLWEIIVAQARNNTTEMLRKSYECVPPHPGPISTKRLEPSRMVFRLSIRRTGGHVNFPAKAYGE